MTGGELLGLADRVRQVSDDLHGTPMSHWRESLSFLVSDLEREAGAVGERELMAGWVADWNREAA